MQLQYPFHLCLEPGHARALARAFGYARVEYNDALCARPYGRRVAQDRAARAVAVVTGGGVAAG